MRSCSPIGAALLSVAILAGCATRPPSQSDDLCRVFYEKKGWYESAVAAKRRYGAPIALQMAVMRQESNFQHDAKAPRRKVFFGLIPWGRTSSAFGYSQALDGTWQTYVEDTGVRGARRDYFDDAVDFVGWYLHQTRARNGVAYSDTYTHYLNYHEGWGGYSRGTHKSKAWLLDVARKVERSRAQYARQLERCELPPPGFWQRLLG